MIIETTGSATGLSGNARLESNSQDGQPAVSSQAGQPPNQACLLCVPNFRRTTSWFFRGGQPDPAGWLALKGLGVKTVICLRWTSAAVRESREAARKYGMNFVSIPLGYLILPTRKEIERFFKVIDDPSLQPIYMHCRYGADRTGVMSAFYRIAREGWDADSAYEEMVQAGFHKIPVHHFKWAVYGFERRLRRRAGQS